MINNTDFREYGKPEQEVVQGEKAAVEAVETTETETEKTEA